MGLIGQSNQMCQNSDLRPVALYLTEHYILSMKRLRDRLQVALIARQSQNSRVADDGVVLATRCSELFNQVVRQSVAESNHAGVASFIVESDHSHNGRLIRYLPGSQSYPTKKAIATTRAHDTATAVENLPLAEVASIGSGAAEMCSTGTMN